MLCGICHSKLQVESYITLNKKTIHIGQFRKKSEREEEEIRNNENSVERMSQTFVVMAMKKKCHFSEDNFVLAKICFCLILCSATTTIILRTLYPSCAMYVTRYWIFYKHLYQCDDASSPRVLLLVNVSWIKSLFPRTDTQIERERAEWRKKNVHQGKYLPTNSNSIYPWHFHAQMAIMHWKARVVELSRREFGSRNDEFGLI